MRSIQFERLSKEHVFTLGETVRDLAGELWNLETSEDVRQAQQLFQACMEARVIDQGTINPDRLPARLQKYTMPQFVNNISDANLLLAYYCALWQESQHLAMKNLVVKLVNPENVRNG